VAVFPVHISLAAEKQQPKPPVSPLENSHALHAAHAGREWLRSIGLDYNSDGRPGNRTA
jgi:hypothetical protein